MTTGKKNSCLRARFCLALLIGLLLCSFNCEVYSYSLPVVTAPIVPHEPYLHLRFGAMRADMKRAIADNCVINFKCLIENYGEYFNFYLLNSTGKQGYGIRWDAGADIDGQRGGYIRLYKYSSTSAYDRQRERTEPWNFTLLAGPVYVAGDSTSMPFTNFVFTWNKASGKQVLKVSDGQNGQAVIEATDLSFSTFSRVYIHAGPETGDAFFDELFIDEYRYMNCEQIIKSRNGMAYDFNHDCRVDMLDFAINDRLENIAGIASQWLNCNDPVNLSCETPW